MPGEVQPIYRYHNNPPGIAYWHTIARTLTQPLMELIADGMIDHVTDRHTEDYQPDWTGQDLAIDKKAPCRHSLLDYIKADWRWGLQLVHIVGVNLTELTRLDLNPRGWHYVFDIWPNRIPHNNKVTRCTITMPIEEQARILIAKEPVRAYCVDTSGNNLPFTISEPIHRRDPKFRKLRLI